MERKIIKIDKEKCNGCGLCVTACHEGAIKMINGKATLIKDDYCDGLGDCLPACPTEAITFEVREANPYDEKSVEIHLGKDKKPKEQDLPCGCPGSHSKAIIRKTELAKEPAKVASMLNQWPVQIQLVPVNAPYFQGAHLLISADCVAYAYGSFHNEFMQNKVTIIGCPKLDDVDYTNKLTDIIAKNDIKSVTIVKMEVPCCTGIANYAKNALRNSGKMIPWNIVTISTDGEIVED